MFGSRSKYFPMIKTPVIKQDVNKNKKNFPWSNSLMYENFLVAPKDIV